jgi:diguanylate cyclase (GGDEF)-like protein
VLRHIIARETNRAAAAVVIADRDGTIIWSNAAARDLLGSLNTAGIGLPILFSELLANGAQNRLLQTRCKTQPKWVLAHREDSDGYAIVRFSEAHDVGRQFDELAYRESIWRLAVQSADLGVWDYNCKNQAHFCSASWKQMRGFDPDAPFDDSYEKWVARLHPDDRERVIEEVRRHNAGEVQAFVFEYREQKTDGTYAWILARGRALEYLPDGVPNRLVGIDINITHLKDEEALRTQALKDLYDLHVHELEQAQQRTEAARQIAHALARQDSLADMPNRRAFSEEIARLTQADAKTKQPFAVLVIDLDRFKPINDLYGHAAGDLVIRLAAERVKAAAGQAGFSARLGGDEFGVLLRGDEKSIEFQARNCAATIVEALCAPIKIAGLEVTIGASVGVAIYPAHGSDTGSLFRNADMALYSVKQDGRGAYAIYCSELGRDAQAKAGLETAVRLAVEQNEIHPFFQPIVDLHSGEICALEILARWKDTTLGSVTPDRFIPVINQLNMMPQFTLSMLRQAFAAAAMWPLAPVFSFNLSAREVCDLSTPLRIFRLLDEFSVVPSRLKIEVTEEALMSDLATAKQVITSFRNAGVKVMLDDFGAGYAGMGYLRDLKFDSIKIDRSFIAKMLDQTESNKIVDAIQKLAESLGLQTVAEGIENLATLEALKAIGCKFGQGFHFFPALSADDTVAVLQTSQRRASVPVRRVG